MTQMPTTQDKKPKRIWKQPMGQRESTRSRGRVRSQWGQAPGNKTAAVIGEHVAQDGTDYRRNGVKGKEPCRSRGLKFSFFLIIGIIIQGSQGKWKGEFLKFWCQTPYKTWKRAQKPENSVLCPQIILFSAIMGSRKRNGGALEDQGPGCLNPPVAVGAAGKDLVQRAALIYQTYENRLRYLGGMGSGGTCGAG